MLPFKQEDGLQEGQEVLVQAVAGLIDKCHASRELADVVEARAKGSFAVDSSAQRLFGNGGGQGLSELVFCTVLFDG